MEKILDYVGDESGASAAEYALILALVAAIIIGGLALLGRQINTVVSGIANTLTVAS